MRGWVSGEGRIAEGSVGGKQEGQRRGPIGGVRASRSEGDAPRLRRRRRFPSAVQQLAEWQEGRGWRICRPLVRAGETFGGVGRKTVWQAGGQENKIRTLCSVEQRANRTCQRLLREKNKKPSDLRLWCRGWLGGGGQARIRRVVVEGKRRWAERQERERTPATQPDLMLWRYSCGSGRRRRFALEWFA